MSESGRVKGAKNVMAFDEFIKLHNEQDDWHIYLNPSKGKLRRLLICEECGFSKSALTQNPLLKEMLKNLELELIQKGVLQNKSSQPEDFDYPDQKIFVNSYVEKLTKLKKSMEKVSNMIASYQMELEKLD